MNTGNQQRRFFWAMAFSAAGHLLVIAPLYWNRNATVPLLVGPSPVLVDLVERPEDDPQPETLGPPEPVQATAGSEQKAVQPIPPRIAAPAPVHAAVSPAVDTSDVLSDSQLAGLANADDDGVSRSGGGGGSCEMARIVEQALQRDPLVHTAVEDAHRLGKAVMLWNGDWVRSGEQDGKGLSAVREVVMWELAFAPESCRNRPMHGLVLLSLADGNTRFAIGANEWRWSDLLSVHRTRPNR